jgi:hypothetical protein
MTNETKVKIQTSLVFHQSDIWDSIMSIIDEAQKSETSIAMAQSTEESKRSHQCGRADGILFIKDLLEDTRAQALSNASRKTS